MRYSELKDKTKLNDTELSDAISDINEMLVREYTEDEAINHISICYDVSSFYLADEFKKSL